VAKMRQNAFTDYQSLSHPSLAERLWAIMGASEIPRLTAISAEILPVELSSRTRSGAGHP